MRISAWSSDVCSSDLFDALPDGFGKARRRTACPDRDRHRRAIDDRRGGEIAKSGTVDDIDEKPPSAKRLRRGARFGFVVERDKTDRRAVFPRRPDPPARPHDQPRLARKGVRQGKSVYRRVKLGGGRAIKK